MSQVSEINNVVQQFYGEKELRWYQLAAANETIFHLNNGVKRVLIHKPTGTGKTLTLAAILNCPEMRQAVNTKDPEVLNVLFLAHMNRLLTQAERTFMKNNNVNVVLRTPFTEIEKSVIDHADLIIIDEAHHEAMMSIQYQLENMSGKPIIGMTATKDRPDKCIIKFEEIVSPISREQAVDEGWLAETYLHSFIDTSGKNKVPFLKRIIDEYHDMMGKTMIFLKTKQEVRELTAHMLSKGLNCVALLNQTPAQLDEVLDAFDRGEIDFIINCFRIGEGVDCSGCKTVILGRQIGSYPLLNQIIGRAARPDCICQVFELINPLSKSNLDTTVVVGTPKIHKLYKLNRKNEFVIHEFDYTGASKSFDFAQSRY